MNAIILKDKQGNILDNNELIYFSNDTDKEFPIRRVIRWAIISTMKTMDADCAGMGGQGNWNIDTFWNYYNDLFPELYAETDCTDDFQALLIDRFDL